MKIMKYYKWIVFLLLLVIGACIVGGYVMPVREGNKSRNKKNRNRNNPAAAAAPAASTNTQDTTNKDDSVTEKKDAAAPAASANTQETTNADEIGDTQDDTDQTE